MSWHFGTPTLLDPLEPPFRLLISNKLYFLAWSESRVAVPLNRRDY